MPPPSLPPFLHQDYFRKLLSQSTLLEKNFVLCMALELAEKSVLAGYGSWNRPGRPADPPTLRVLCSGARRSGHSLTLIGFWGQTPGRSWVTVPAPCDSLQYGDVLILITIATRELTVSHRKGTFWTFNKSRGLIVATGCCYKGANS